MMVVFLLHSDNESLNYKDLEFLEKHINVLWTVLYIWLFL